MSSDLDRRAMLALTTVSLLAHPTLAAHDAPLETVGPMVGHVGPTNANIWFRGSEESEYSLVVGRGGKDIWKLKAAANAENDLCVKWRVTGLQPATEYYYAIVDVRGIRLTDEQCHFKTAPEPTAPHKISLAFGSCAKSKPIKLWSQIDEQSVDGLVLLGDTPYIDSTKLEVARRKHREFLSIPQLAKLIEHTPTWGTWDDHDFGKNDSDGRLSGKEYSRKAFVEYRANHEYGQGEQGIYTKFEYGPVEVFLLDTRWFARTEKSPVDPSLPTLLGAEQWKWLKESLLASKAKFKLLTCGMIWDDKENTESDDWGSYTHERDALYKFVGENQISGVVLIGGDIHCSRLLKYDTEKSVGYPIHQFIVSPIHDSTIPKLNVPHPNLVRGEAIPHVWMRLEVDSTQQPAKLHAEWIQMDGIEMWDITLSEDELSAS